MMGTFVLLVFLNTSPFGLKPTLTRVGRYGSLETCQVVGREVMRELTSAGAQYARFMCVKGV